MYFGLVKQAIIVPVAGVLNVFWVGFELIQTTK